MKKRGETDRWNLTIGNGGFRGDWNLSKVIPCGVKLGKVKNNSTGMEESREGVHVGEKNTKEMEIKLWFFAFPVGLFILKTWRSMCLCLVVQLCPTFATLWTVACQAPLSMGFSRQEYWHGLPFPPPGDLPDPRIEPVTPALAGRFLPLSHLGSPRILAWVAYPFSRGSSWPRSVYVRPRTSSIFLFTSKFIKERKNSQLKER